MKKIGLLSLLILSLIVSIIFSISASKIKIENKNKNAKEIMVVYLDVQKDIKSEIPNVVSVQTIPIANQYNKSKSYKLDIPKNAKELSLTIKDKNNKSFLLGIETKDIITYDKFKASTKNINLSLTQGTIAVTINSKKIVYNFDKEKQAYIRK